MKTFEKLTPEQKRVAIAKDMLAQIEAGQTKIVSGRYWTLPFLYESTGAKAYGQAELKQAECECCAAAGLFLSGIRLFNSLTVQSNNGSHPGLLLNNPWFSNRQMAMVECAFERDPDARCMLEHATAEEEDVADDFGREYPDTIERAQAIFRNIIKNNGEFIP